MSANNWRICPQCKARSQKASATLAEQAKNAYGSVSEEEYHAVMKRAAEPVRLEETLREDYELWTDQDGKFGVYYGCSCDVCGFSHEFKHDEKLQLD